MSLVELFLLYRSAESQGGRALLKARDFTRGFTSLVERAYRLQSRGLLERARRIETGRSQVLEIRISDAGREFLRQHEQGS